MTADGEMISDQTVGSASDDAKIGSDEAEITPVKSAKSKESWNKTPRSSSKARRGAARGVTSAASSTVKSSMGSIPWTTCMNDLHTVGHGCTAQDEDSRIPTDAQSQSCTVRVPYYYRMDLDTTVYQYGYSTVLWSIRATSKCIPQMMIGRCTLSNS